MKSSLPPLASAGAAAAPAPLLNRGWPVLRLGFRPFYILGALLACASVPVWIAAMVGGMPLNVALTPLLWHAHEMLFGFATAIIVGFLLTAVKAWTGLATPRGALLGGLALLWLAARLAALGASYGVYAVLDMLLLPIVGVLLLRVLLRAGNQRNLPLIGILLLLALANLAFHLSVLGTIALSPVHALYAGLALIVMIECVMAGRVVPAFTTSVNPGLKIKLPRWQEMTTLAVTGVALLLWVCAPPGIVPAIALALAGVLHGVRIAQWHPLKTLNRPILWILHASYAWIPAGLVLLALAQMGWVSVSVGVHALAVGATGGLIIGMLTRTARGHTGRPLQASRAEVLAYALVMGAALVRVFFPIFVPQWYGPTLVLAAAAWSIAFGIYLVLFTPWLLQTRADGKDG